MKRTLSAIALALVLALCFGLMAPAMADTAEPAFARDENGYPDLEGNVFEIWYPNLNPAITNDLGEMEVIKKLEELFNCDIQLIHAPQGQTSEHFAITMAGDTLPDMFYSNAFDAYYPGGVATAYADGILFDYTDMINEVNAPNFCSLMLDDEFLNPKVKDDHGRIIRMGAKMKGSAESDFWLAGLAVRNDHLAATGLDMPETIADWYELLTTFKANGIEYPLLGTSGHNLQYFGYAYGINARDYYADADGKIHYGPYEDVYKDYLTEMNKWYSEELINQDYMNLDESTMLAIISNDRAGSVAWHFWNWANPYYQNVSSLDETKQLTGAQLPKLNDEDELTNLRDSNRTFDDFKYITVDAENPLACIYLLDALYYPEISNMMQYGIEGVAWDSVNGFPVRRNLPEDHEDKLSLGISQWHMYESTNPVQTLTVNYGKDGCAEALQLVAQCGISGFVNHTFLFYTEDEAEVRSDYQTDLSTYVNEMNLKFITGQTPLDEFDDYQEQLKALGVEELISVVQAAYDRYLAR